MVPVFAVVQDLVNLTVPPIHVLEELTGGAHTVCVCVCVCVFARACHHTLLQEKLGELTAEAKKWQDECEAQSEELVYLKEMVSKRDQQIATLKRTLEANGLAADLG